MGDRLNTKTFNDTHKTILISGEHWKVQLVKLHFVYIAFDKNTIFRFKENFLYMWGESLTGWKASSAWKNNKYYIWDIFKNYFLSRVFIGNKIHSWILLNFRTVCYKWYLLEFITFCVRGNLKINYTIKWKKNCKIKYCFRFFTRRPHHTRRPHCHLM